MLPIPQTECCTILGIDPKTLRSWMRHANMLFTAHPMDARLKCLPEVQVQQLAMLHDRPLPSSAFTDPLRREDASVQATPSSEQVTKPVPTADLLLPSGAQEPDLRKLLASLESKVATLQEQVAQLALELLRERGRSVSRLWKPSFNKRWSHPLLHKSSSRETRQALLLRVLVQSDACCQWNSKLAPG